MYHFVVDLKLHFDCSRIIDKTSFKSAQMLHSIEILIRYVEDLKRGVSEVLEECLWDEKSQFFKLRGFWDTGVNAQSPQFKILEELESYWRSLGRGLEEAAR